MKALRGIFFLLLAIAAGAVAGLLIAAIIVAAGLFALADAIFHLTPQHPVSDE